MGHPGAMLRLDNISYAVAGRPLIEGASAMIPDGHKGDHMSTSRT